MSDVLDIAGLVRIQFLEVAVDDLCDIGTISNGERPEWVPEDYVVFLDLVAAEVVQNQLKCEKYDTKDDCPDKESGLPAKSIWIFIALLI